MPAITNFASRTFIETVTLPRPPRPTLSLDDTPPVQLKSVEAQSLVVGSGLVVASAKVPADTRTDLLNCTLFAQLVANAGTIDAARIADWYHSYFAALTMLGWAQSDTQLEKYEFGGRNAEAHKAVLKVVGALLGPQAAAIIVVKAAIDALQSMSENSPALTLFERESKLGKSARFQVATAELDSSGLLQVAVVGFGLQARSTLTQVLFFKSTSSSTKLEYAAGKASIYEAVLKDQREAIAARLAAYRASFVREVKLPPLDLPKTPSGH